MSLKLGTTQIGTIITGSSVSVSYNDVTNKPLINSITISGNKTGSDYGLIDEPATEGTNGQALTTDGNGGRSWTTITSGATHLVDGTASGSLRGTGAAAEDSTYSVGPNAVAFGEAAKASGNNAFAAGNSTVASGNNSHAEGIASVASGVRSHAEGYQTVAQGTSQHVQGEYNIIDTENTYAHIVGKGTSDENRANIHTIDWSGNGWYAGTVSAGTINSPASVLNANNLTTKSYVDGKTNGINKAKGYTSYSTLITELNSAASTEYSVGQNFYIQTLNVPDLWVYSVESSSQTYTYTTDDAFVTALETNGYVQVGYYKLSMLETLKQDLTNYVQTSRTIAGLDLTQNRTAAELKSALTFSAADIVPGTFSGQMVANSTSTATIANSQIRNIYAGTTDLTDGVSPLDNGVIYLVYEG